MFLLRAILDLLFPPHCPFCGKLPAAGRGEEVIAWKGSRMELPAVLCARCAADLPWLTNCCPRCARPLALQKGQDCSHCREDPPVFTYCCALGSYEGALRDTLHRFKYRGEKGLAEPLGRLLAARLAAMPWIRSVDMLVPVPLYRSREQERGYNQAALLAEIVGRELSICSRAMLQRNQDTPSQTGLSRRQRFLNMEKAFSCGNAVDDCKKIHLLLVDDILTSGATANAAALALRGAGWERVSLAVIAR